MEQTTRTHNLSKRLLSMLLAAVMSLSLMMTNTLIIAFAYSGKDYTSNTALAAKLDNVFNGNVKLFSNTNATYPVGSREDINFEYSWAGYSGYQCYAYAQAVYYYLFGDVVYHGSSSYANSSVVIRNTTSLTYDSLNAAGVGCGAYVRTTNYSDGSYNGGYGHSMIILSYDKNNITILHGNADNNGLIKLESRSWSNFNTYLVNNSDRRVSHVVQPNLTKGSNIGNWFDDGTGFYAYIVKKDSWMSLQNVNGNVQLRDKADSYDPRQIWKFNRQSDLSYEIVNMYDDTCLDAYCHGTEPGTNVGTYTKNNEPAQRWFLRLASDDSVNIFPSYCNLSLDVDGNYNDPGTNIKLWTFSDNTAQRFSVYKLDWDGTSYSKPAKPDAPSLSVKTLGTSKSQTTLQWTSAPLKNKFDNRLYDLRIYKGTSASGTPVATKMGTTDLSYSVQLDAGTYTAQAASVNTRYADYWSWSNVITFTVPCAHEWNNGTITTEATYDAPGVRTYTCSNCGGTKTETIPSRGTVTIHFNPNGGTGTMEDISYPFGTQGSVPASKFKRPGYRQIGWVLYRYSDGATNFGGRGWVTGRSISSDVWDTTCYDYVDEFPFWVDYTWYSNTESDVTNEEFALYAVWTNCQHTWNAGSVTTPATYTAEGVRTYTCTVCGATKTESIPVLEGEPLTAAKVTLSWTGKTYTGSVLKPSVTVKNAVGTVLVNGSDYTVSYSANSLQPGAYKVTVTGKGYYKGTVAKSYTIVPGPTTNLKVVRINADKAVLTWNAAAGAEKYMVYYATAKNGTYTAYGIASDTSYVMNRTGAGKLYYQVCAFVTDGSGKVYGTKSEAAAAPVVAPGQVKNLKATTTAANQAVLSWTAVPGAEMYMIYTSATADGTFTAYDYISGTSYTMNRTNAGKYYYKVRAYVTADGAKLYGPYSAAERSTPGQVKNLKVTTTAANQAVLSWTAVPGAEKYMVYTSSTAGGTFSSYAYCSGTTYTMNRTDAGKYYYKVRAYVTADGAKLYGPFSAAVRSTPGQVKNLKATTTAANQAVLSWTAVPGAEKYMVYTSATENGTYSSYVMTASTSYTVKRSNADQLFYKVRAYVTANNVKQYGGYSAVARCVPGQVKNLKAVSTAANKVSLSWNAVPGAEMYMIYTATTANGTYSSYVMTANTSYTISRANASKLYYKVRAYATVNGAKTYGAFSAAAQGLPGQVKNVKAVKVTANQAALTWDKVPGAEKYMVYYASSQNGTYTAYGMTASASYTMNKTNAGAMYYKVRAFVTVDGARQYGAFSTVVKAK